MPTIALIRDGSPVREHKNKYGQGITPHYLENAEVCKISFDSTLYSEDQANEWLQSHDYKSYSLEEQAEIKENKRYLAVELSPGSDIQHVDGGLLVPDVVLLAPGTWTDSTQKQPCRYTDEALERHSLNWTELSYWSRHGGGVPRDITDRIADIKNVRYQNGVTADLLFHGATQKSRDAIGIIEAAAAGKIAWPYSSVEMRTRDKWILSEKLFEAQEIIFDGAAMVSNGACRVCKIRNNEGTFEEVKGQQMKKEAALSGSLEEQEQNIQNAISNRFGKPDPNGDKYGAWIIATFPDRCIFRSPDDLTYEVTFSISDSGEITFGNPVEVEMAYQKKEQEMADVKELEAQIEQMKKELEEAKAKPAPTIEIPKELSDSIAGLIEQNKTLSARLEKLENQPTEPATSQPAARDLDALPEYFVPINRKSGIIGA